MPRFAFELRAPPPREGELHGLDGAPIGPAFLVVFVDPDDFTPDLIEHHGLAAGAAYLALCRQLRESGEVVVEPGTTAPLEEDRALVDRERHDSIGSPFLAIWIRSLATFLQFVRRSNVRGAIRVVNRGPILDVREYERLIRPPDQYP